jgi:hypothetical protein
MSKNPAAVALGKRRWAGVSQEERSQQMSEIALSGGIDARKAILAKARAAKKKRKKPKKSQSTA